MDKGKIRELLSPKGRFTRKQYLVSSILLVLSSIILGGGISIGLGVLAMSEPSLLPLIPIIPTVTGIFAMAISAIFTVKRLHDLGKPGWQWLLVLVPIYQFYHAYLLIFKKGVDGVPAGRQKSGGHATKTLTASEREPVKKQAVKKKPADDELDIFTDQLGQQDAAKPKDTAGKRIFDRKKKKRKKGKTPLGAPAMVASNIVIRGIRLLLWAANIVLLLFVVFFRLMGRTLESLMMFIPRLVSRFMPKKTKKRLDQQLIYAGMDITPEEVVGITLVYAVVVVVIVFLIAKNLGYGATTQLAAVLIAFGGVLLSPIVVIMVLINKRAENVDKMLPDVLSIIAQNMASGMTSYNALWSAARPEFGPCAEELQFAAKDTLTGAPMTDALFDMTRRVQSEKLSRSVRLIIQGINSGGDLPDVLDSISNDIRMEINLRSQMASETNAQALFTMFASLFGSPMLLAVSLQFITMFSDLMERLDVGKLAEAIPDKATMFTITELAITPDFFETYAVLILFVTGFFAALLVGILRKGKAVSGVVNIPFFVIVSIAVFFTIRHILTSLFAKMMVV